MRSDSVTVIMTRCFAFLAAAASLLMPTVAGACDCVRLAACEVFWTADAVFVGPAERVELAQGRHYRAHLLVERWFRGQKPGNRIVIDTRGAEISCDAYTFNEGQRYLVFAVRGAQSEWRTPLCGGTQPFASAATDLELVRGALRGRSPGSVSGSAFVNMSPSVSAQTGPPLVGARLRLESPSHRYTTTTDKGGDYRFEEVAAGTYTLQVDPPPGVAAIRAMELEVHPSECVRHRFGTPPR
jgi:hypothetical protein